MSMNKVTILGGGVLGTQIGLQCAYAGKDVTFWLRSESSIGRTKPKIERYSKLMLEDLAKAKYLIGNPMGAYVYPKGLIRDWSSATAESLDELLAIGKKNLTEHVHIELDMAKAVADADVVIESMSENPEAKTAVYEAVRDLLPEKTLLFTNSSTLLPSMFAEVTGRPEKYCAVHFANEIWKNNTAEIMGHPGTDPEVFQKAVQFAEEINMIPLEVLKEQPGYILNSLLVPFLTAAQALYGAGIADYKTIDKTWELATGAPAGPFKILDIVGLETAYNINAMKPDVSDPNSATHRIAEILKEKIEKGETGVNAGKGFYDYKK